VLTLYVQNKKESLSTPFIKEFYTRNPKAGQPLKAWVQEVKSEKWKTPQDVKRLYRSADILPDNRVVCNIGGNNFRLVVKIHYNCGVVYIRFIGNHAEYDKIDAEKI
jgi:mRNA interferase HigB